MVCHHRVAVEMFEHPVRIHHYIDRISVLASAIPAVTVPRSPPRGDMPAVLTEKRSAVAAPSRVVDQVVVIAGRVNGLDHALERQHCANSHS